MPEYIKTLDDIINRQDPYDLNKVTYFTKTDDGELIIPDKNMFDTYMAFVRQYVQTVPVQKKEREYYRCKPHLLSLDIYGTPNLYWLLLMLNDKECPSKFYIKQTIRIIPSEIISKLYQLISSKSNAALKQNWGEYLRQVGEEVGTV